MVVQLKEGPIVGWLFQMTGEKHKKIFEKDTGKREDNLWGTTNCFGWSRSYLELYTTDLCVWWRCWRATHSFATNSGKRLLSLPNLDKQEVFQISTNENLNRRLRYQKTLVDHFWRRWRSEYLLTLREQYYHDMTRDINPEGTSK